MKKVSLLIALTVLIAISQTGYSQTLGITGSAHDFSASTWNTSHEICKVCHTPHNADITVANAPLWNHALSTQTFQLYASGTLNAAVSDPDGSSKLCLSCHDGTVALESFGGTTGTQMMTGKALLGTDLRNDHPISISYDATLIAADHGLNDPATTNSGLGGHISDDLLIAGKMQCSSCHDVHNSAGVDGLLRKSNSGSALCLTCHKK